MKKYIVFLIILMSFFIGVVKAEENVYINEITVVDKSEDTILNKEPVKNGLKVDFDLKFTNVGDYVKFKMVILNRDSEDYTLSSNDKSNNGYIKYEYNYENDNKVVVAGGEKIMYVTITYAKEVPGELFKDGKYNETHSTNLSFYNNRLPMEEMRKIENPKTSSASILLIVMAILLSLLISFLLSNRKMRKYLGVFVIGAVLISPILVYAIESLSITINTNVVIEKKYKFCQYDIGNYEYNEYDYTPGEKVEEFLQTNNIMLMSSKFISVDTINCFKDFFEKYSDNLEEGEDDRAACLSMYNNEWNVKPNTASEDVIKGKEEGCYVGFPY